MKVLSKFLAVFMLFSISFMTVSYAEDVADSAKEDVLIDESDVEDEPVYIDNYDDYEALLTDEEIDPNAELKSYYEQYKSYLEDYYNEYKRDESNKARVIEAEEPKESYEMNYQNFSVSKYISQKVKAKILDGKHEGEEIELDYMLSADSLNNIILAPIKAGDVIFVAITEGEDGTVTGDVSNSWSTVERINIIVIITAIVILLFLIYGGKNGFSTILISAIGLLFGIIIIPYFSFLGMNIIVSGILEIIALIFTINFAHLGTNKKAFKSALISFILTLCSFAFMILFNYITRTVGTVFEFAAIADNIILRNINFVHLFYIISSVIRATFISNSVATAVKRIERENAFNYDEKVTIAREVWPGNIVPLVVTGLTLYIPNQILLVSNKFTLSEVANAETLISELIRIIAISLCIIIAVPVVSLDIFGFGKRFLNAPKDNEK